MDGKPSPWAGGRCWPWPTIVMIPLTRSTLSSTIFHGVRLVWIPKRPTQERLGGKPLRGRAADAGVANHYDDSTFDQLGHLRYFTASDSFVS